MLKKTRDNGRLMKAKTHKRNQVDILQMEYKVAEIKNKREDKMAEGTPLRNTGMNWKPRLRSSHRRRNGSSKKQKKE